MNKAKEDLSVENKKCSEMRRQSEYNHHDF